MRAPAFLALGLLALAAPAAAQVEARVRLEPEVIGQDEVATLTIEARGDGFSSLRFQPDFALENLEIISPPSHYEDMRFGSGGLSQTVRMSWLVRPLGPGRGRVRDITIRFRDQAVQLPALDIRVQREPTRVAQSQPDRRDEDDPFQQMLDRMPLPWSRQNQQPEVFVRSELQPRNAVVGQQVLYSVFLYTREDIGAVSPNKVPDFRGFWARDIPIPQQLQSEMVEIAGRRYARVPLLRKALFPLRPGRHQIEPSVIDVTVQKYDRSFFFRSPVARPEGRRLLSEAETLNVRPLPPSPPGFGGTVGQLAMAAQLEPQQLHLGEAATLTVRVAGTGNLQSLPEPKLSLPAGLTAFPPQQEGVDGVTGATVRGTRVWRYAVIPKRSGEYTLEPPRVSYFDPQAGEYRVATAPGLVLTALPAARSAEGEAIGPHGIRLAQAETPGWHWPELLPWLFVLPWGLALLVTLARRRAAPAAAGSPGGNEALSAAHRLEDGLRQAAAEERPRQLAARVEEAWREFLASRWGLPAAMPMGRWRESLAEQGVNDEALEDLGRLLEDLQYLRFAPQLSSTGGLRDEVLTRSRQLLRRLQ